MQKLFCKAALAAIGILGTLHTASAQQAHRNCASHEHYLQQMADHPEMVWERQRIEQFTESYTREQGNMKTTAAIYNIPVVVHVLYNTSAQNISDAQILSQIDVLNKDFQKLNSDAGLVPSAFAGLVADCQIQFCLATKDPQGGATTGIIRKSTSKTVFDVSLDDAKSNSTGGDAAWPAGQYLNLWVVPAIKDGSQTGILGYAQFPGGPASTDGVVIAHVYFGTTGTAAAPFNKGRTGTHEVGHWLNLYHIWGDDGNGCSGSDAVGDTPNQGDENYGCPGFPQVSCSNGPNGDMFMNYMDYTDDACMYMFTSGQKTRMHGVLVPGGFRASLASSQGCSTGGTTCAAPTGLNATGITTSAANLSWTAASGATSYNLQWKTSAAGTWNTVNNIAGTGYALSGLSSGTVYNFQVQSNCSSGTSVYTASSFTTTSSGCTDNYEPNESSSTAAAITPGTVVNARIGSSTDKDYFKFSTSSSATKVKVTLGNLPADFDLRLYRGTTLVGTSQNGGTASETLVYNYTTAANYTVYVYGYNGAYSTTQCYNLLVQTSASNFREEQPVQGIAKLGAQSLTLFPNPAGKEVYFDFAAAGAMKASISFTDQSGRLVKQLPVLLEAGSNRIKLDVQDLPGGFYIVKLLTPEQTLTSKLVVGK